jgi:hypothetical protein
MGMYVYRVTAQRVKLTDGTEANVAVFAYKPYRCDDRLNREMDFRTGCPASRRMKEIAPRIVLGDRVTTQSGKTIKVEVRPDSYVYDNPRGMRTFHDDINLGVPGRLPRVPNVNVAL